MCTVTLPPIRAAVLSLWTIFRYLEPTQAPNYYRNSNCAASSSVKESAPLQNEYLVSARVLIPRVISLSFPKGKVNHPRVGETRRRFSIFRKVVRNRDKTIRWLVIFDQAWGSDEGRRRINYTSNEKDSVGKWGGWLAGFILYAVCYKGAELTRLDTSL